MPNITYIYIKYMCISMNICFKCVVYITMCIVIYMLFRYIYVYLYSKVL